MLRGTAQHPAIADSGPRLTVEVKNWPAPSRWDNWGPVLFTAFITLLVAYAVFELRKRHENNLREIEAYNLYLGLCDEMERIIGRIWYMNEAISFLARFGRKLGRDDNRRFSQIPSGQRADRKTVIDEMVQRGTRELMDRAEHLRESPPEGASLAPKDGTEKS